MSREIKYRAWIKYQKRMVDVLALDFIKKKVYIEADKKGNAFGYIYFDDCILMECTGFKDKNGKKVFEGDIVTAWSQGCCGKFQIKWREDGGGSPKWLLYPAWQNREMWGIAASRENDGQIYDRGLRVIGNICENPELLKDGGKDE